MAPLKAGGTLQLEIPPRDGVGGPAQPGTARPRPQQQQQIH